MRELLGKKLLFFDGAMGTMLQNLGMPAGVLPDTLNVTHPDTISQIHRAYLEAGCDIITTNTFGCNEYKLKDTGYNAAELASAAVTNAKKAAVGFCAEKPRYVALDIGPSGRMLKPLGDLGFEEACASFGAAVKAGALAGADLIIIETMSDTYELKAAVLAAKENCNLPVIASVTLDKNGRMLTGGDLDAAAALLEGLGVDVLGINCSFGPKDMMPFFKRLLKIASVPVLFMPNAGMPRHTAEGMEYDVTPDEYAVMMSSAAGQGAWLIGGCCGTMPEHMAKTIAACEWITPAQVTKKRFTMASSYSRTVYFGDGKPVLIGERINPTGKKLLKQALREKDYDYILREGIAQQDCGVGALDVNVGMPEIDEAGILPEIVQQLQAVIDLPLQIDTADTGAMARAMRIYNGKPIVNSVNGKESSMESVFPLAAKYGGVVVALTLDENGIPDTAAERVAIAKKILRRAEEYGIAREDIVFDALTMAVSAGADNAAVTLETLRGIKKELGAGTVLGVSNVSFGLPNRELLNAAFFSLALEAGLDAAIINPHKQEMLDAAALFERGEKAEENEAVAALMGKDPQFEKYIAAHGGQQPETKPLTAGDGMPLGEAVLKGLKQRAAQCARLALDEKNTDPLALIEAELVPALNEAGTRFEAGSMFLPQLLMSAEAAKAAFEIIRSAMGDMQTADKGTIVVATVEGDVHDIGKNIVRALLENYRFKVIDLGKDVPVQSIVDAALEHKTRLVGLSALMTTTVPNMAEAIKKLNAEAPECKVMVGGAVLTEEYAGAIGADCYAADAMASVRYAQDIYAD